MGRRRAARLCRGLGEEGIRRPPARGGESQRLCFFAPPDASLADWLPGETLLPQEGVNLGGRMSAAFDEGFRRGARRVAIVGTDVPFVSRDTVLEAFGSLDDHDLVVGRAHDGGYYLLAVDRPRPALFQGMAWSTPAVLAATVERAGALGLTVRLLEPLRDIDTLDDVRAELPRLEPLLARAPGLAAAVARALDE